MLRIFTRNMILTNHTTSCCFFFVWKLTSDAHEFWNEHRFVADFPNWAHCRSKKSAVKFIIVDFWAKSATVDFKAIDFLFFLHKLNLHQHPRICLVNFHMGCLQINQSHVHLPIGLPHHLLVAFSPHWGEFLGVYCIQLTNWTLYQNSMQ